MPVWLISLIPFVWRWLKHWGIYILITLLIAAPFLWVKHYGNKRYDLGYKTGYAKAIKDNPTNTYNAPTTVNQGQVDLYGVKVGRHWGFGIVHQ